MKHLENALDYVHQHVDMEFINHCIIKSMQARCPFSLHYPMEACDISDLLEEYGDDNDLPEGWWCEHGDIDDIVEML